MIDSNDLITYVYIKCNGDIDEFLDALKRKIYSPSEEEVKETLKKIDCKFITLISEDYPSYLKSIPRPPIILFYKGDISLINESNLKNNIAFVGSRECSLYGEESTRKLIAGLPKNYVVVSGGAIGIDAIAHKAALENNLKTICVLGNNINNPYPKDNYELFTEIEKKGLIISEFVDGMKVNRNAFPLRNRIISGVSNGVVVTEAHPRSGTSITVGFALEQGKSVMCVPAPIEMESFCNDTIRMGATLIRNSSDILEEICGFKS